MGMINNPVYNDNRVGFEMEVLDSLPKQYRDLANEYGTLIDGALIWDHKLGDLKSLDFYINLAKKKI